MLKSKPYFTWRIDSSGARFEAKINGIALERNTRGSKISYERPVNEYMFSGKNRISVVVYPYSADDYGDANVKLSLFVSDNENPDSKRVLLGRIVFTASGHKLGQGLTGSQKSIVLNSTNDFKAEKNGDVIVSQANLEPALVRPGAINIFQDIELETPFPRWGFLDADAYDFPLEWSEYVENIGHYRNTLRDPIYEAYLEIYRALSNGDVEKFLNYLDERSTEKEIAYYMSSGTVRAKLKASIERELASNTHELRVEPPDTAPPIVSDNRNLIKLTEEGLIYFEAKDESSYHNYEMQMYKKDGKWIVSR